MWIDSHCHLDAPEFDADRPDVIARAQAQGVVMVIPSVAPHTFVPTQLASAQCQGAYALGIHPLFVRDLNADALDQLKQALDAAKDDPRLVAVGEIGLDHFVPELQDQATRDLQERIYAAQLDMAQARGLPVILHVRRSADALLKHLRRMAASGRPLAGGIACQPMPSCWRPMPLTSRHIGSTKVLSSVPRVSAAATSRLNCPASPRCWPIYGDGRWNKFARKRWPIPLMHYPVCGKCSQLDLGVCPGGFKHLTPSSQLALKPPGRIGRTG